MKCCECRWWGAKNEFGLPVSGISELSKKHCGKLRHPIASEGNQAYLESGDYASSEGVLWTEPDFFCASFEGKPL